MTLPRKLKPSTRTSSPASLSRLRLDHQVNIRITYLSENIYSVLHTLLQLQEPAYLATLITPFKDLTKHYNGTKVAVDRLSINFYQEEITAFLGQNGAGTSDCFPCNNTVKWWFRTSGKSTTMNMLVGLLPPTKGEAVVFGMDIQYGSSYSQYFFTDREDFSGCSNNMAGIRKTLGFVPQYDILYPDLTVEDHLQFFGWLKGVSTKQSTDRSTELSTN